MFFFHKYFIFVIIFYIIYAEGLGWYLLLLGPFLIFDFRFKIFPEQGEMMMLVSFQLSSKGNGNGLSYDME